MEQIDLSDLFTTKVEANDFLARLTTISEMFFETGFNLEHALHQQFGVNKSDRLLRILRASNINPESIPAVKDFFIILIAKISSLPVISLTIAFEPQDQTLKSLAQWFFINMHRQVLFDLSVDSSIIAGAHITYNGKFFDFSIKSTFERILQDYMGRLTHPNAQTMQKPALPAAPAPSSNPPQQPAEPAVKQDVNNISFGR